MASIRGKNTKPEIIIRKLIWSSGKRYRIHDRSVSGIPDISNKTKKIAIFIDGCFWHGCERCYKEPKTNGFYWRTKIQKNKERRRKVTKLLYSEQWIVFQYWEHDILENPGKVTAEINSFL